MAGATMENKLKKFISKSTIFLVTDNKLDRMSWKKAFNAFSVKPEQIVFFESFEKALDGMETNAPNILICAYEIKESKADVLLEAFRERNANLSESLSLVVADAQSPSLALACLELELDETLLKPYNARELDDKIKALLGQKVSFKKDEKALFKALEDIRLRELDQVAAFINSAPENLKKQGRYGLLEAQFLRASGKGEDAIAVYERALEAERAYGALTGLFDALVEQNRCEEAYAAVCDLLSQFPLHPKRLSNFVKVCILTSNYHSFVEYGEKAAVEGVEDKTIAQQLAAGLAICAKSIGIADRKVALEANLKALKLGREKSQIVDQALKNLLALREYELVNNLVGELAEEKALEEVLAIAEYRSLATLGQAPFKVFQKGMELTNKGVHDFHVYELILKSAKEVGRKKESLEEIADNASKHHPEKSEYFKSLVA